MKTLLFALALCPRFISPTQAVGEYCKTTTLPNAYGIDSCFNDSNRNACRATRAELTLLLECAINKVLDLGFNGYQFSTFFPFVAELFAIRGQNMSTLNYLATYCLNGSHADQEFCQAPASIENATCGAPIALQVPTWRFGEFGCAPNEAACQSVQPSDPTFSRLLANEVVCFLNLQRPFIRNGALAEITCYFAQMLSPTDLAGSPVKDQVETLLSQMQTTGACPP